MNVPKVFIIVELPDAKIFKDLSAVKCHLIQLHAQRVPFSIHKQKHVKVNPEKNVIQDFGCKMESVLVCCSFSDFCVMFGL